MEENKALVYLDHNVLDLMTKGDPPKVIPLLDNNNRGQSINGTYLSQISVR